MRRPSLPYPIVEYYELQSSPSTGENFAFYRSQPKPDHGSDRLVEKTVIDVLDRRISKVRIFILYCIDLS